MKRRRLAPFVILSFVGGCIPMPSASRVPTEIWLVRTPRADTSAARRWTVDSAEVALPDGVSAVADTWIVLDSATFRPILVSAPPGFLSRLPSIRHFALVTSFQGARYHPEVVRGLIESRTVLGAAAGTIATSLSIRSTDGLLLDLQDMAQGDLRTLADVSRELADSARAHSRREIGIIIPASDSAGYPARILARTADVLIVRLYPEHGVGNAPGPVVSLSWFARGLGGRASEVGVNRLAAGVPADGILWNSAGDARSISYAEAIRLARSADVAVTRDPASGNLHATSSRDGWELWVADHELIRTLIAEARRIGVTRIALFGTEGADPELWRLPEMIRR